jgi:hypothetical protein
MTEELLAMNDAAAMSNVGGLDPRVRRYLKPVRLVWQSAAPAVVDGAEELIEGADGSCHMHFKAEAPGILVDFGQEIHGGVQITNGITPAHAPVRVRVRFGESVAEAMGETDQDHAIHDHIIQVPWYGYAEIGNTGFRFVRIDMVDPDTSIHMTKLQAVFLNRDLKYAGSFRCSDERLNKIWETGAYTVHLCMQDMLWDGIKRDRLVWIGDMHPETMVINTVFGEQDIVPKSLDYVRDTTALPDWMNGISSYSIWWVRIQRCWYDYHGNREYLEAQRPYLKGLLEQLLKQIGEGGREQLGATRFLDWPTSEMETAVHAGLHALLLMGLDDGAHLCEVLGEGDMAARCREGVQRMRAYTPPLTDAKQANALLVLAELADAKTTNEGHLAKDPFSGQSTFYGYYVLQARAMAGDYEGCLEVIRKYWGGMLDVGATTFWEHFDLSWIEDSVPIDQLVPEGRKSVHADFGAYCFVGLRHSLCHGWAAGPTAWLTEHVLGLRPLAPGCAKLAVQPHLAGLEWAEGTFPTPAGVVRVRHEARADGSIHSSIEAPEGIEIVRG